MIFGCYYMREIVNYPTPKASLIYHRGENWRAYHQAIEWFSWPNYGWCDCRKGKKKKVKKEKKKDEYHPFTMN